MSTHRESSRQRWATIPCSWWSTKSILEQSLSWAIRLESRSIPIFYTFHTSWSVSLSVLSKLRAKLKRLSIFKVSDHPLLSRSSWWIFSKFHRQRTQKCTNTKATPLPATPKISCDCAPQCKRWETGSDGQIVKRSSCKHYSGVPEVVYPLYKFHSILSCRCECWWTVALLGAVKSLATHVRDW
jgi:hypothetical protein